MEHLSDANLSNLNLSKINLLGSRLNRANLMNSILSHANLRETSLQEADLQKAKLVNANLSNANMAEANLQNANFGNANLSHTNLSNANLREAIFYRVDAPKAGYAVLNWWSIAVPMVELLGKAYKKKKSKNLDSGVDLDFSSRLIINGTDLSQTKLEGVNLSNAKYVAGTKWPEGFDPEAAGAIKIDTLDFKKMFQNNDEDDD